jgi:hypothetical protein
MLLPLFASKGITLRTGCHLLAASLIEGARGMASARLHSRRSHQPAAAITQELGCHVLPTFWLPLGRSLLRLACACCWAAADGPPECHLGPGTGTGPCYHCCPASTGPASQPGRPHASSRAAAFGLCHCWCWTHDLAGTVHHISCMNFSSHDAERHAQPPASHVHHCHTQT